MGESPTHLVPEVVSSENCFSFSVLFRDVEVPTQRISFKGLELVVFGERGKCGGRC